MNSLERVVATIMGEQVDRPPVIPVMLMQGAQLLNIPLNEYQNSGHQIAKGQIALIEKFGHDAVFGFPHVVQDATPWGAGLVHFKEGPPSVSKMVINDFAQIDQLQAPDPLSSRNLHETLEAIASLKRQLKGEYPVIGAAIAPFSLPSMLMGTEKFMSLLFDDQTITNRYLNKLLQQTIKFVANWCNLQVEAGADTIVLADGIASATVLRRDQFEKFALPTIKEIIKQIPVPVVYESVGATSSIIDLLGTTGAAVAVLDSTDDLITSQKKLGTNKLALMGNLNNISSLEWSELKMKIDVRNIIHETENYPFIISFQGPEVPFHMPHNLLKVMIDTVKQFGTSANL